MDVGFFEVLFEVFSLKFSWKLAWNPLRPSRATIRWRAKETIALRRVDYRGRIDGHIGLRRQWRGLSRPGLIIALGRLRQPAARRRFDLKTPVTRQMARARVIVTDMRNLIDIAATIDGRLHLPVFAKAPFAFDHRIGCIDAVNDDGHAGAAGNDDVKTAAGESSRRHRHQDCQCHANAHCLESRPLWPQLNRTREAKG